MDRAGAGGPWVRGDKAVLALAPAASLVLSLALVFIADGALSVYHAGVEWKFWPGPEACTGGGHKVTIADMRRLLRGGAMAVPQCDKPAWVFLGLSMSGWNVLLALGLATGSLAATWVNFRTRVRPA